MALRFPYIIHTSTAPQKIDPFYIQLQLVVSTHVKNIVKFRSSSPIFWGEHEKIFELPSPRCPSSCIKTILKSPEKAFNSLFSLPYSHLHRADARRSALPPMARPMGKLINHPPKTWMKMWKNISKWREVEKVSGDLARDSFEYLRSATSNCCNS